MPRLSDLPEHKFTGQDIIFIDSQPDSFNRSSLRDIFEWIRETATKEGLTIELQDDRIVFIKN